MIKLSKISKKYKIGKSKFYCLENINIEFCNTGLYFLIGESGSGKTSLLNILALIDTPTTGSLIINNKLINFKDTKKTNSFRDANIYYQYKNNMLLEEFSVIDNIKFYLNKSKKELNEAKLYENLKLLNIDESILNKYYNELSGGELERVSLLIGLMLESKIFLLDEPTSSLDKENALSILKILEKIKENALVIIATHDSRILDENSNIISLKKGKIIDNKTKNNNSRNTKYFSKTQQNSTFLLKFSLKHNKLGWINSLLVFISAILISFSLFGFFNVLFPKYNYSPIVEKLDEIEVVTISSDDKYLNTDHIKYKDIERYQNDFNIAPIVDQNYYSFCLNENFSVSSYDKVFTLKEGSIPKNENEIAVFEDEGQINDEVYINNDKFIVTGILKTSNYQIFNKPLVSKEYGIKNNTFQSYKKLIFQLRKSQVQKILENNVFRIVEAPNIFPILSIDDYNFKFASKNDMLINILLIVRNVKYTFTVLISIILPISFVIFLVIAYTYIIKDRERIYKYRIIGVNKKYVFSFYTLKEILIAIFGALFGIILETLIHSKLCEISSSFYFSGFVANLNFSYLILPIVLITIVIPCLINFLFLSFTYSRKKVVKND